MKIKMQGMHIPLFLAGKNFGSTLDVDKVAGLELDFDPKTQVTTATYKGKTAYIGVFGVVYPDGVAEPARAVMSLAPQGKIKAQASTPTDHVFAPGPGKVKDA